jgi:hypothetical protein
MMKSHKRNFGVIAPLALGVFFSACSQSAQGPGNVSSPPSPEKRITSESVVQATTTPVTISPGSSAEALIKINVQSGYHVNANPPTYPYLKPTTLEIPPADGISVGFITYPTAVEKKFPFAEKSLAIYEGETTLKATLKADKTAKPGERSLPATLRIQACDDQVCYAPGKLDLAISLAVK